VKFGVWLVAGTPVDQPYPCRCHERKGRQCSAAWCPCAGRLPCDRPPNRDCCSYRFGPGDHVQAMAEWRIWKLSQGS
jgi:hypothetical protein